MNPLVSIIDNLPHCSVSETIYDSGVTHEVLERFQTLATDYVNDR